MTEEKTELALIEVQPDQYPSLYVSGGLDPYYQQIRAEVLSEVPDLSNKKGIERVKSLAAMVSKSKTKIEKPGREYLKQLKEMPKLIEAELRDWATKMDALRDEVRQPVTDMEEKEKARIANLDFRMKSIKSIAEKITFESASSEIELILNELLSIEVGDDWQEYKDHAQLLKYSEKEKIESALKTKLQYEEQQAEIDRLRKQKEESDRIERERLIAEQAANNAKIEAERDAMKKQQEAEQREKDAVAAKLKAEQDAKDAQLRLEQELKDAEERQRLAVQQAADRERQRQADEQNRIAKEKSDRDAAELAKAANVNHRKKINDESLADLIVDMKQKGFDLPDNVYIEIIKSIAKGNVRNVSIKY